MMPASDGVGKADVEREVVRILYSKSVPNADKGEGVKKTYIFVNFINESPLGRERGESEKLE